MLSSLATSDDVISFLQQHGISDSVVQLFVDHQIDGLSFPLLTEQDLKEMQIASIGQRKQLLFLVASWRHMSEPKPVDSHNALLHLLNEPRKAVQFHRNGAPCSINDCFSASSECDQLKCHNACGDSHTLLDMLEETYSENSQSDWIEPGPQFMKLGVSAFYVFLVTGLTSFVMVAAHERLPDISKYPPLPDLFLDNLPYIKWAFQAAEWVGVVLMVIWFIILVFHRYRFILLRRFFALLGTVFLLRCITMLITSLSVPDLHLTEQCSAYVFENSTARIMRVLEIWLGFGMSIRGIKTCGDYMFSGHTTVLTLLNFFITEYSPRRFSMLHTFSWVLNLFGVFFILASHEHYSIDVFVAIYVSSRLFLYYHCLANSRILYQEDKKRAMIWFPLFSFFEYDVNGIVPNTYEIPFYSHWSCSSNGVSNHSNMQSHSRTTILRPSHSNSSAFQVPAADPMDLNAKREHNREASIQATHHEKYL